MIRPEIVLGPPGTGKTTTLLGLVQDELAAGVPPDRIGYVSFTRRAAQEARDRACERFKFEKSQLRYFRTLHSTCFDALGLSNSDVFEGKKVVEFGEWIGYPLQEMRNSDEGSTWGFTPADRAMFMENLARVRCVPLREQYELDHDGLPWSLVERISRSLAKFKNDNGLLDYTDMLQHFVLGDYSPHLERLFVDEAQDLSRLQWQVVDKLASRATRVVLAGDDDQAIYRWAGAAVEDFVDMPGSARVLDKSWRCPAAVQSLSQEVIGRVGHRRPKAWAPRAAAGILDRVQSFDQVDLWGPDLLILGRNAFVLKEIMPKLRSDGIIFEYQGHSSVSRNILEAVRTWERLRQGEEVTADEARHVYEYLSSGPTGVKRGYKSLPGLSPDRLVSLSYLREHGGLTRDEIWHVALERIPREETLYMLRARQKGESLATGRPRVRLSTIHGAKGGEAEHVVVMRDVARRTFDEAQTNPEDEARVFYVAVTRARERLTVVAPRTATSYDL